MSANAVEGGVIEANPDNLDDVADSTLAAAAAATVAAADAAVSAARAAATTAVAVVATAASRWFISAFRCGNSSVSDTFGLQQVRVILYLSR